MTQRAVLATCAILVSGCAAAPAPEPHPLLGSIVRAAGAHAMDAESLIGRMREAQVVYLGEKHGNPQHHALQLRLVRELLARGRRPAIGLEIFSVDQTSTLMRFVTEQASPHAVRDPRAHLRQAVGWRGASDWRWRAYGPLLELAREHGLQVFGADLPVALRRRIAQVGIAGLNPVERGLLPPLPEPDAAYSALMRERIREAHCGHGSDAYLDRLLQNWFARNETMALAVHRMLEADGAPVVLVVGAGHLRHDLGVPPRVAQLHGGVEQVNLGLTEVLPDRTQAADYTAHLEFAGARFAPDHPYLWFTAPGPAPASDPCAVFRRKPSTIT